jgi:hypothetical protein
MLPFPNTLLDKGLSSFWLEMPLHEMCLPAIAHQKRIVQHIHQG